MDQPDSLNVARDHADVVRRVVSRWGREQGGKEGAEGMVTGLWSLIMCHVTTNGLLVGG